MKYLRIQLQEKSAAFDISSWSKYMDAIKFERTQIHFLQEPITYYK